MGAAAGKPKQVPLFLDDRFNNLPFLPCPDCGGKLRWAHIHNPHNDSSRPWGLVVRCESGDMEWQIAGTGAP